MGRGRRKRVGGPLAGVGRQDADSPPDGGGGAGEGATTTTRTSTPAALPSIESMIAALPPKMVRGLPNPDHYRQKLELVNQIALIRMGEWGEKGELPGGYKQLIDGILAEVKLAGIDPKVLQDARSEGDKALDLLRQIRDLPLSIWEALDEEIDAVEKSMDAADRLCVEEITDQVTADRPPPEDPDGPKARFRRMLARVRRLRERARKELPRGGDVTSEEWRAGVRAAHTLRFMVYVGRSAMEMGERGARTETRRSADAVYQIARIHARMAVAVWQAENGVDCRFGKVEYGVIPYTGCILMCPPGHSKSSFGRAWLAKSIALDPYTQALMNHAVSDEAETNMQHVSACFKGRGHKEDNPDGRRCLSLFPSLRLAPTDNNANSMRLKLDRRIKAPTLRAFGVKGAISGADSTRQWWDDPVDQKEVDQETERRRTFDRLNGTWLTRLRGQRTFLLITATAWHNDDAVMRFIQLARDEKAYFRVLRLGCGGPKTTPAFRPLWPEAYPAAELRRRYAAMNNARLWSAAYMANPIADENRIIKSLKFYDPNEPNHRRFVAGAIKRLSVDPSATGKVGGDKAGLIYTADGDYITEEQAGERTTDVTSIRKVRVLAAREIHATQTELSDGVAEFCRSAPVDYVHYEAHSWAGAFADDFENRYGVDVIRHNPSSKSKDARLRAVGPLIENENEAHGFGAVVEFPGVPVFNDKGEFVRVGPDPALRWLYEQILDFGVCAHDHALDGLTQVLNFLAPDLRAGAGAATQRVVAAVRQDNISQRKREIVQGFMRAGRRQALPPGVEEQHWWALTN